MQLVQTGQPLHALHLGIALDEIDLCRSGDKGDTSNVCVYARKPEYYKIIEREVTPEKLKAYFGDMVKGEITRYDVPLSLIHI